MREVRRIEGFDLLRGLCAIGVVVYHILYWTHSAKLYNVGLYGVYIFFVLSGASLYVSYSSRMSAGLNLAYFLGLRYFRLAPLYVLAVLLVPLVERIPVDTRFLTHGFLNLTLLFGFYNPGQTAVVTGGWSLGIEVVYYFIFPILIALISGRWNAALIVLGVAFVSQLIVIHRVLDGDGALVRNWVTYIQPLSFVFYFVAGCLIGKWLKQFSGGIFPAWLVWAIFSSCIILIALTSQNTAEESLLGMHGISMMLLSVIVVYSAGLLSFGSRMKVLVTALGNMSYGLYLLHTFVHVIVYNLSLKYAKIITESIYIYAGLVVLVTIIIALILEKYYERPVRNTANRILESASKRVRN